MQAQRRREAYIYLSIATFIILSVLIGNMILSQKSDEDPRTGCNKDVHGKTVFLIDHTDGVPEQTRHEILSRSLSIIQNQARVNQGDLVSIFILSDQSEKKLVPGFQRCKPREDGYRLFEKPETLKLKFERDFRDPIIKILEGPIPESNESPIAEAIIDLSLSEYLAGAPKANLIIFSDLMENSRAVNMYRCQSKDSAIHSFRENRSGAVERPSFKNVRIEAHIIPRRGFARTSLACRDGFWNWFFGDNAGSSAQFIPDYLPG